MQSSYQTIVVGAPYVERFFDDQNEYRDAAVDRTGAPLSTVEAIEFREREASYEPGTPVLTHVSFVVPAGSLMGVVGPSGAGKSTFVQLLLRLRDPGDGQILINATPIDDIALSEWYRQIAFVPQEARLIPGTIAERASTATPPRRPGRRAARLGTHPRRHRELVQGLRDLRRRAGWTAVRRTEPAPLYRGVLLGEPQRGRAGRADECARRALRAPHPGDVGVPRAVEDCHRYRPPALDADRV